MRRFALYIGLAAALVVSCSTKETDIQTPQQDNVVFYASFEQPAEEGTRVYANEDLHLRWTADDRVSIFNKLTYNQQYKFTGETGDNAGGFKKVDTDEFVTGNAISHVVSVYPYQELTKITESEVLILTLPAEQHYAENTFGLGANTMVSVTTDNVLQYKNVGGYLMLKLYGEDVSVSSITLKGNNGEKLAGKAAVTMPQDGTPSAVMAEDATDQITLICDTPVTLGATEEEASQFWFVVPPITFEKGFTITVNTFLQKSTSKSVAVNRNNLSKMSPIEVGSIHNIVFADESLKAKLVAAFDTNSDGELSYSEAAAVVSAESLRAAFGSDKNYKSFEEFQFFTGITRIAESMFKDWTLMKSIILPETITSIDDDAFRNCSQLTSLLIPDSVTTIGSYAFGECHKLSSINIPNGVESISNGLFLHCGLLSSITIPDGVTAIGSIAFAGCTSLKAINIPSGVTIIDHMAFEDCEGLTSITIPGSVKLINDGAFFSCGGLTSVVINEGVTTIGYDAFGYCTKLASISIPKSVSNCTGSVFTECTSITHLYVNSVEDWLAFLDNCGLYAYTSPLEATSQAVHFYTAGTEVTSLCFSYGLVSIPKYAFMNCAYLTTVSIPETVSSIGVYAFYKCVGLKSVEVLSEAVPRGGYGMFSLTGNSPIYVPKQSVNEYKTAEVWNSYADRIQATSAVGAPTGYALVWSDEFDGAGQPSSEWWYETGGGGWGNNEIQEYVAGSKNGYDLASVSDGKLKIKAQKIGGQVYSIRMNTERSWKYGYFEARIKVSDVPGAWPALCMMPKNFTAWPKDGEIDIMEYAVSTQGKDKSSSSIHCNAYNWMKGTQKTHIQVVPEAATDFHVYAMEWTSSWMKFYVDGELHLTFNNDGNGYDSWPFDQEFYLKLNLAWGGNMGGTTDENQLPAVCEVDYVRVYQKEE